MTKGRTDFARKSRAIFVRGARDEKGAIVAWFALMIFVLVGFGALALDISYAMMMRNKLQVSTSSAALAGAAGLVSSGAVQARAEANANGDYRPDDAFTIEEDNVISAWPTKLTLTPSLADKLVGYLKANSIVPDERSNIDALSSNLDRPDFANAYWDQYLDKG